MSRKGKKRAFISVTLAYVLLSLTWIIYLFVQQSTSQKAYDLRLTTIKTDKDSIQKRADFLQEFLIVDNNYILGAYDQATTAYDQLLKHPYLTIFEEDLLALRIRRIEEILSHRDTLSADIEAYRFSLNVASREITELQREKDSLLQMEREKLSALKTDLETLRDELAEKNKKLNQKDKVQVISFRNDNGNLIHYLGEVKNGMASGGGVGIWDTGSIYKGDWKENQRHGKGLFEWKDGHKYEGQFVNDTREGQGTYFWSTGEKYVGAWKDGQRNGQGTLYDRDNNVQFAGEWLDDKIKK